jgi:hypothetical protein
MVGDIERAMFEARANFLVAQGLSNYTEIVGAFIKPHAPSGERFDAFFSRMGLPYQELLKNFNGRRKHHPHVVYDDLRCGLTHEYVIKRKRFTIYNPRDRYSEEEINNRTISINGVKRNINCGVMHVKLNKRAGAWLIINAKYWLDFRNAIEKYYEDLNIEKNKDLRKNFFQRARQINFLNFQRV